MKKNDYFLIIGGLAIVVLVFGGILFSRGKSQGNNEVETGFTFKNAVGQKAPDFNLLDADGNNVSLSGLAGKNAILFFNEGLMCYPACLDQVVSLGKDERLNNSETVSFSIIANSPKDWQRAQKELPYLSDAKVLFDPGAKVSRIYGTLSLSSAMHKGVYPGHTYFIIDKEGIVKFTMDDPYMGQRNDELANEILKLE